TQTGPDDLQPGAGIPDAGTVSFYDGPALLRKVTVTPKAGTTTQGAAQFTTAALGLGPHSLAAQYSGEFNDLTFQSTSPSTANAVLETINPLPAPPPRLVPADVTSRVSVAVRPAPPPRPHLRTA